MSCFLFVDDEESNRKINIDELYQKKQQRDLKQLSIFKKLLNRIHKRIMFTSRAKNSDKHIWFTVPEYIFGEPLYDKGDCIGYLVSQLEDNGFHIRYIYPNTLFVSWNNWIPSYVRSEVKKKTGMVIDEKGNIISKKEEEEDEDNDIMMNRGSRNTTGQKEQKVFTPIGEYKPMGNLVYNKEMFEIVEKKIKN
jgi:hypothetical protein